MDASRKRLGEILTDAGILSDRQLQEALERKRGGNRRLGHVLVEMGLATEEQICTAVAGQQGLTVVDLTNIMPDPQALERVPAEIAIKHCLVPLKLQAGRLTLVMADPMDMAGYDAAWRAARCTSIEKVMAPESEVEALIQECYTASDMAQQSLKNLMPTEAVSVFSEMPAGPLPTDKGDFNATEAINAILGGAVTASATHVHLEPTGRAINVRFRVDGKMRRVATIPGSAHVHVIGRLRSLFQVDPNQHAMNQEGKARIRIGQHHFGLRLQVIPSMHGETSVIRILDPRRFQIRVEDLGFSPAEQATIADLLSLRQGMVLVVGPVDAGTGTTLYSFMNQLRDEGKNLVSVEDPVEAILTGVTQVEIHKRLGITYPAAVRSAIEHDPDILSIADIGDAETAALALRAAMSGQLVLAGIRASSAAAAIALLLDMGLEPYLVASALEGVIGQRIMRCVCHDCKAADEPDARSLSRLGLSPADLEGKSLVKGAGCRRCEGSGYVGRVRIFEVARVRNALRKQIAARASAMEIARTAHEEGMGTLRDAALAKVFAGQVRLAEAAAVVPSLD